MNTVVIAGRTASHIVRDLYTFKEFSDAINVCVNVGHVVTSCWPSILAFVTDELHKLTSGRLPLRFGFLNLPRLIA